MTTSTIKKDTPIIIKKQYHINVDLGESELKGIMAYDLDMSTPSGYEVLGVYAAYTGSTSADVVGIRANSTGTQKALWIRNYKASTIVNLPVYLYVAYIRSDLI